MQIESQQILNHPKNNIIFSDLMASMRALIALERDGFEVLGVGLFGKRPTIQVHNGEITETLIREERACYYRWQKADGEYQRFGQFQVENCRVIWIERGH